MKIKSVAAFGFAFACCGCSMALDENSGVFAATPGKYDYLDCRGIQQRAEAASVREGELTQLMQRANQDPVGPMINVLVYRDELNMVRSNRQALQKASDEKRCLPDIKAEKAKLGPMH